MNQIFEKKCKVCETPYLLKYQVGYVEKNQFSFECPTCGVMIEGTINVNNKERKLDWNFDNLVDYSGDILKSKEGYFLQLTSEFYENKISLLKDYTFGTPTPFIRNFCDYIENMNGLASYLAEDIHQHVNHYKNLINLVLSNKNNVKYVFSEFEKLTDALNMLDEEKFTSRYKTDRYDILFRAITDSIKLLLNLNAEKFQVNDIREKLFKMYENKVEFKKFKTSFQDSLPSLINLLTNAVYSSVSIIPGIIPTIASETYDHRDIKAIREQYGLSTANYKTLLKNYAENYEILGKIMPLIAAIDNINTRGDINNFVKDSANTRKNDPFVRATTSLKDFSRATIGIRIQYLKKISSDVPRYNDLTVLNNRIRNAINHSSVEYDSIEQKLTFKDGSIITERYLIEFAEENYVILYLQLYCLFIVCSLATKFAKEDNA
ncbi:hypothetical protein [Bacillus thuringiensis]|uniref:Uncharacterized protein n=1 Tax=Bacillus thuringiensis subsp. konkukian (strain 97-27) TaxID=281309 RepID=Q5LK71_BACHK|nr:hypothetical protein [Bacillus thuringiensis]AAW31034.1 hypothetical protein pBT9727_0064 [[Bacillus thuringiensis] serovar konkukian str. 97-27]AJI31745.1 hypothetical protein BG06_5456 [Bacillus thuringiensis]QKI23403.1 hypothetical protein FOC86_00280 [Bacillus thuringiensis]